MKVRLGNNEATTAVDSTQHHEAIPQIDHQYFVENIWDYTNPNYQLKDSLPCIVDFTATWCAPCQRMVPILEELAAEYKGRIHIYQVDVDHNNKLAKDLKINGIPHFLFLPVKDTTTSKVGSRSKEEMQSLIEELLLKQ